MMEEETLKKASEEKAILHLAGAALPERYPFEHLFELDVAPKEKARLL